MPIVLLQPNLKTNTMNVSSPAKVSDAIARSWVYRFVPESLWPYAQLARWERPIGWWLLMWPGWWALGLANILRITENQNDPDPLVGSGLILIVFIVHLILFMLGAMVMRGAGCTYNDLADHDIDNQVARTRSRPLPSGRVSRKQAMVFLVLQLVVGLVILLQFNNFSIWLGVASLITIAIYPFMKRVTWWPQLFLGFAFSWGALMGWSVAFGSLSWPPALLYLGSILWVIGYDTIYAHQDKEDDALVGVKSTARLFGDHTKGAITLLYCGAITLFASACFMVLGDKLSIGWPVFIALALGAIHMLWQVANLKVDDPDQCLKLFKSNSHFGWIFFAGLVASIVLSVLQ